MHMKGEGEGGDSRGEGDEEGEIGEVRGKRRMMVEYGRRKGRKDRKKNED